MLGSRGAFGRLLEGYDHSLFDTLRASQENAAICVKALQESESPWTKKPDVRNTPIGELAKLLIWEERLPAIHARLGGINWKAYEAGEISVNVCTRHGDLHGENVRVDAKLRAMLLDYGSVDALPSAIDAVTLELSPFFHPHGHRDMLRWKQMTGSDPEASRIRRISPMAARLGDATTKTIKSWYAQENAIELTDGERVAPREVLPTGCICRANTLLKP